MQIRNDLKKVLWLAIIAPVLCGAIVLWTSRSSRATGPDGQPRSAGSPAPDTTRELKVDLDKAVAVTIPDPREALKPVQFTTADGKQGFAVKIPGGRPIATPAYADGMIFAGGGYGSHEFYAFDAQTGRLVWQAKTSDDGPTAAVVEDGYVAFNTESCTVLVYDARTGKLVWQEWLGDPLMSQPAISKGRLYMAHPAGQRGGGQMNQGLHATAAQPANVQSASPARAASHRLLCADLRSGRHIWETDITADVISAPVVSQDQVYFTCFDGTSFCINAETGAMIWTKANSSTSAPLIAEGQVVITQKENRNGKNYEGLKRIDRRLGEEKDKTLVASSEAGYLQEGQGGGVALTKSETVSLDASVGFGGAAPPAANLKAADKLVGVNSVAGAWAYQGSRPAYSKGKVLNAQGKYLNCMRATDGRVAWRAEVGGSGIGAGAQVFSPPALGERNMYLCSGLGHLISVHQQDGKVGFMYQVKQPMAFQPILAKGNVYVGTSNGMLICLKTGDGDADGWYEWGGNAQHNKN